MKISRNIFLLSITALVLVIFNGCCKDQNPYTSGCQKEPAKYLGDYPLGEIKDYLYFKPGSMWVYECDSTLELDTQIIVSSNTAWTIKPYVTYEYLDYIISSKRGYNIYTYKPTTDVLYNDNFKYFYSSTIINSEEGGRDNTFFYPFKLNGTGGGGANSTFYRGYLDSMEVLNKWYKDIRIFEVERGATYPRVTGIETWEGAKQTIYWSKHVGIVRMHIYTIKRGFNTEFIFNWNLKEDNVIQ